MEIFVVIMFFTTLTIRPIQKIIQVSFTLFATYSYYNRYFKFDLMTNISIRRE
jgi:hypothetical protein